MSTPATATRSLAALFHEQALGLLDHLAVGQIRLRLGQVLAQALHQREPGHGHVEHRSHAPGGQAIDHIGGDARLDRGLGQARGGLVDEHHHRPRIVRRGLAQALQGVAVGAFAGDDDDVGREATGVALEIGEGGGGAHLERFDVAESLGDQRRSGLIGVDNQYAHAVDAILSPA